MMMTIDQPRGFTDLQADLPTEMLGRSLDRAESVLRNCFEQHSLIDVIGQRMRWGKETVVLDAACGTGAAIEEIARTAAHIIEDQDMIRGRVRGIGIDLNPRPDLIPGEVLSINYDHYMDRPVPTEPLTPRAEFRRDDMRTLATVPDNSVDVLYSVSGLEYVDDCLRALEASWRVLKEGGIMGHEVPHDLVCEPSIFQIIKETHEASDVFSIREAFRDNDYLCDYRFILGKKKPGNNFRGFPYKMTSTKRPFEHHKEKPPHYKYVVVGIYERISA